MTVDHRAWMAALAGNLSVAACDYPACPGQLRPVQPDWPGRPDRPAPWPIYEAQCDANPRHVFTWPGGRHQ